MRDLEPSTLRARGFEPSLEIEDATLRARAVAPPREHAGAPLVERAQMQQEIALLKAQNMRFGASFRASEKSAVNLEIACHLLCAAFIVSALAGVLFWRELAAGGTKAMFEGFLASIESHPMAAVFVAAVILEAIHLARRKR